MCPPDHYHDIRTAGSGEEEESGLIRRSGGDRQVLRLSREHRFPFSDFPINVEFIDSQEPYPLHTHGFSEIVVILEGTGNHFSADQSYALKRGDTFFIPEDQSHGFDHTHDLRTINIYHDFQRIMLHPHDLRLLNGYYALFCLEPLYRRQHSFLSKLELDDQRLEEVRILCTKIGQELTGARPGFRLVVTGLFMILVGLLSRFYGDGAATGVASELLRIGEAIAHLEQNYVHDVRVADLARMANMSTRNFQRVFRNAMGTGPLKYRNQLRIAMACELLSKPTTNVTEVAYQVGFRDASYFSRAFRTLTGFPPSHYKTHNHQ